MYILLLNTITTNSVSVFGISHLVLWEAAVLKMGKLFEQFAKEDNDH